jgi:hypothetical protein
MHGNSINWTLIAPVMLGVKPHTASRARQVTLREITAEPVRAVMKLSVTEYQKRFVASNAWSLGQALFALARTPRFAPRSNTTDARQPKASCRVLRCSWAFPTSQCEGAGTHVAPPQLDEFFCSNEAALRAADFAELGFSEAQVWGIAPA